jgi:hypothetical protein
MYKYLKYKNKYFKNKQAFLLGGSNEQPTQGDRVINPKKLFII